VAIVEFALVVPLLFVILLGIIDFGFMFSDVIDMRQAVRDAERNAVVGNFGSDTGCSLTGFTGGGNEQKLFCMAKGEDGIPDVDTRLRLVVGASGCSGTACYQVGQPITLCEQYKVRTITGMTKALAGKYSTTRTVLRIEIAAPAPGLVSATESSADPSHPTIPCAQPDPVS
jgi:hypothetical protein